MTKLTFDPASFMNQQVTGANDTKLIPVPVGEYAAVIEKVDLRSWVGKKDPSQAGVALDIIWSLDSAEVKKLLGRDKVTVKQGIMLEMTDAGQLDIGKGKNIGLGRLREAVGLNKPGKAFSISQLSGQFAKVSVGHRIDDRNPSDPAIFAEVQGVVSM